MFRLPDWPSRVLAIAGFALVLFGAGNLLEWHAGIAILSKLPLPYPLHYDTAWAFALCGLALFAFVAGARPGAMMCALAAMAIGIARWLQQLFPTLDIPIHPLLGGPWLPDLKFDDISPPSALGLVLGAGILLALKQAPYSAVRSVIAAMLAFSLAALAGFLLLGSQSSGPFLYGWLQLDSNDANNAVGFMLLAGAALFFIFFGRVPEATAARKWASLAVWLAVLLASVALWQALRLQQAREMQARTEFVAGAVRMELTGKLQDRIRRLQRSAERGASARMPSEQIRAEAPQLLNDVPEFRALAWANPGLTVRWAVPDGSYPVGNELLSDPRRKSAVASARNEGAPAITGPLEILDGQRGFEIHMPVYRENKFHGLLIGVVMHAGWLESLLADRFAQYSIALEEGGQLIGQVRLRERASGSKWRHRQDLSVLNTGWVLEVTPTQATVDAAATVLPQVTLAMGIVLATLLAFTMFLFQVTLRRARDAAEANRLLALDNDARKRAEQALRESEQELRISRARMQSFSWYLQAAREEEKTRIARDLHDELGATLTALRMDSSWLSRHMTGGDEAAAKKSRSVVQLADSAIQFIRRTITELRPSILDNLGLVAALRWQAKEFQERTGIVVTVDAVQDDAVVDKARAVVFFRIFQEALTNVLKHAKAKRVTVRFADTADGDVLEVADDGAGMAEGWALKETSHGILGMQERARELNGDLVITSSAGQGTTVKVTLPAPTPVALAQEVSR